MHDIAQEAARIICDEGVRDYRRAKAKAAERLGVAKPQMPANAVVQSAVREHLLLFGGPEYRARLHALRETALSAMRLCQDFSPRAVGAVVNGLATARSPVQLHLFADAGEAVDFHLGNHGVPFDEDDRRFRHPDGRYVDRPLCVFMAGEVEVELAIFELRDLRWAPLAPDDGLPMERLTLTALRELHDAAIWDNAAAS